MSQETKKNSIDDVPECQENLTLTPAGQFWTSTPCQVEEKKTEEFLIQRTEKSQEVNCPRMERLQTLPPGKENKGSASTTQGTTPEGTSDPPKDNTELVLNKSNVKCPLCKESHRLSRCNYRSLSRVVIIF